MANCRRLAVAVISLFVLGCQTVGAPEVYPPDFTRVDSDFVEADCTVLASPFINEYARRYVQFDAVVIDHRPKQGMAWAVRVGCAKSAARQIGLYWASPKIGRSVARFVLDDRVRVYGYVLPNRAPAVLDPDKPDIKAGFVGTVVLLIRLKELEARSEELGGSRVGTSATGAAPPPPGLAASAPSGAAPRGGGLKGTFVGKIMGSTGGKEFVATVMFRLVRSGDQVTGYWQTGDLLETLSGVPAPGGPLPGLGGTVSGTVQGETISSFRAQQLRPCQGDFGGSVVIESNGVLLRGSYGGSDCRGSSPGPRSWCVARI